MNYLGVDTKSSTRSSGSTIIQSEKQSIVFLARVKDRFFPFRPDLAKARISSNRELPSMHWSRTQG